MDTTRKRRTTWTWVIIAIVTLMVPAHAQNGVAGGLPTAAVSVLDSTKEQDGLVGSVRRVKVQSAKLELKSGQPVEGPLQLLEITTYGLNGNRIDNAYYPDTQSAPGKEEYKYNDKGNIVEMTLRGNDGSILSRENYEYEFDDFGNWKKMVTSLVVFEDGELKHEPIEVTYREIAYYFDDSVAKMVKLGATPIILPPASPNFPELINTLSAKIQPETVTIANQPLSVEVGSEPPELSRETRETVTTSVAESNSVDSSKAPEINTEPVAISLAPANITSAAEARDTSPPLKELANNHPAINNNAVAYYEKGRESFASGASKEAVDFYRRSLELEPQSAEVYLSLGHAYLKLKKPKEAGKAFKEAIHLNPEMAEAHYGLGLNYFGLGQYKNAADAFKRATVLRPNMAKAHYGLGLAYQGLGRLDDVTAEIRILENLDRGLARQLSERPPESNLPCGVSRLCQ